MFDVCTTGDMAHIDKMCALSPVVHTSNISSCQKKVFWGREKFH